MGGQTLVKCPCCTDVRPNPCHVCESSGFVEAEEARKQLRARKVTEQRVARLKTRLETPNIIGWEQS